MCGVSMWNCVAVVTSCNSCVWLWLPILGIVWCVCVKLCSCGYLCQAVCNVPPWRCLLCYLSGSVWCTYMKVSLLFQAMCDVSAWRCVIFMCVRQCVMYLHAGVLLLPVSGNVWCTYMWVCYCYLCQAMCDIPTCGCVTVTCVRQCVMYLHAGVLLLPVSGSVWCTYMEVCVVVTCFRWSVVRTAHSWFRPMAACWPVERAAMDVLDREILMTCTLPPSSPVCRVTCF